LVPLSGNRALAGMITRSHSKLKLKRFLESNFCRNRISYDKDKIRQKVVPLKPVPYSYHNRVLIVGDAAGHVKPTTGGGIYLGIRGAKIAAKVLINNLAKDTLSERDLLPYEKKWKSEMNIEFLLGSGFRWFYNRLDNAQLEKLLARTLTGNMAMKILNSPDLSFDHHSRIILSCLHYCLYYPIAKLSHIFTGKQGND
jgi:flavin-dependent dehydrogenase